MNEYGSVEPRADDDADEVVDYVALDQDENLLVEFAATGLTKRFVKINMKSVERYSSPNNYVHAVFLDEEDGDRIKLMLESQEFDYSNNPKLRQCVIEQFGAMPEAKAALAKVKVVMGQVKVKDAAFSKSNTKFDVAKERAAIGLIIAAAVAILLGGAGAFLGGLALFHKFYN
jgi:hypothetical protein